jgi:hypothetical protein
VTERGLKAWFRKLPVHPNPFFYSSSFRRSEVLHDFGRFSCTEPSMKKLPILGMVALMPAAVSPLRAQDN